MVNAHAYFYRLVLLTIVRGAGKMHAVVVKRSSHTGAVAAHVTEWGQIWQNNVYLTAKHCPFASPQVHNLWSDVHLC